VWPTGTWNPDGRNKWTYTASSRVSHNYPNCTPIPGSPAFAGQETVSTIIYTEPGEVFWYIPPSFVIGPCEGVKQYNDAFIYKSSIEGICTEGGLWSFIRTGGTRSHSISVSIEPLNPGPDDEPFPGKQEYAERFL